MSEDLVSLRMMVIGAAEPDQGLWRQATALASILFEFTIHDVSSAVDALAQTGTDICILDATLSDAQKTAVIDAARAVKPVPLVFVSGPKGVSRLKGIDGHFTKPANVEQTRKLVEVCVRAKLPTGVLILDDSGTMRSIVRKILAASHFNLDIYEASEGIEALNHLRGGDFGIIFVDYNMPGLNGFDMLSQIQREIPSVAVVMMSSTLESGIADKARKLGALAYLKKPFYTDDTDATLARYFGLQEPLK
jgi:CheY-like chemotaxis protein